MNLSYQWIPWAYSHQASKDIAEKLWIKNPIIRGYDSFDEVWESVDDETIAILPIENSYAWTIHANVYNFLDYDYEIVLEYKLPVRHCLLWKTSDIKQIDTVYSHPQALAQCKKFCEKNHIKQAVYHDTAWAAQYIAKQENTHLVAIASRLSAELYDLNIIAENIQDNDSNTTRFFVIKNKNTDLERNSPLTKTILLFSVRNGQGILYKCLGALATHGIDLSKIESIPSKKDPFSYMFWVECLSPLNDAMMQEALKELSYFTTEVRVLGEV